MHEPGPSAGPRAVADPLDEIIDSAARDILDNDDPLGAETWASGILDLFEAARREARLDGEDAPPFEASLVERCRHRGDVAGLLVLSGLAAVAPPPLQRRASQAVDRLARVVSGPPWLAQIGGHQASRAYVAGDVFGDQESVMVGFGEPGSPEHHALSVLIDHNLSGQAKDAWLAADLVASWQGVDDPVMRIEEFPVDDAMSRLRAAMAMSDLWDGDTDLRTEDFGRHRALVWARLRSAGLTSTEPVGPEVSTTARGQLVTDFLDSDHAAGAAAAHSDADVEVVADYLVGLRSDYEGRPLRWSPTVVELVLTDLAPRKLLLQPAESEAFCDVTRAMVRFAADRTGLADEFVDLVLEAVDHAEPTFRRLIDEPGSAGPAKAILTALQQRGVDMTDRSAIEAALDELDPDDIDLGGTRPAPMPRPSDDEARASAEGAAVLARFDALTEFYGPGRKLTQTGNPTLADARTLVGLLGTDDEMDPTVGDHSYRTKSAAELPELMFTIRWAKAAGALRVERNKLVATANWARLTPLARWERAAEALPELGPLGAFWADARVRGSEDFVDLLAEEILNALAEAPAPFELVLDGICRRGDTAEWHVPYLRDPETRRMVFRTDLDRFVTILGWAGIVERLGAVTEPDPYSRTGERLVGGTVAMTPAGRWWFDRP